MRPGQGLEAPAWIVLHGGPGSGASAAALDPLTHLSNPLWAPAQRHCPPQPRQRASPLSLQQLTRDLAALQQQPGLASCRFLGGSWGALLGLAHALQHPTQVQALLLRGSFTGRPTDLRGFLSQVRLHLARKPAALRPAPGSQGTTVWMTVRNLERMFHSGTHATVSRTLCHAWATAEAGMAADGARRAWAGLLSAREPEAAAQHLLWGQLRQQQRRAQARGRMGRPAPTALHAKVSIQLHLLARLALCPLARQIRQGRLDRLQHLPVHMVHGLHDRVCPPATARQLAKALPQARLSWCHAGHLAAEPLMRQALRDAAQALA